MLLNTICRVCLSVGSRVHSILNTPLQEVYEKITDIQLYSSAGKPNGVCYICYALLRKTSSLITRAHRADQILNQFLHNSEEISDQKDQFIISQHTSLYHDLATSVFKEISIDGDGNTVAKDIKEDEINEDVVGNIKEEEENSDEAKLEEECGSVELNTDRVKTPVSDNALPEDLPKVESDSEDDVPLKNISSKKRTAKNRVRVRKRERLNTEKGSTADYAQEIILTKEQQLQEILDRAKSLNYLNSPLKCELCYKGFVDPRAYANHQKKHDLKAGPYQCDICRMRYDSQRQLRTHSSTSHERRYQCKHCNHRSHTANQAREHEKWHSGYTYECQLCGHKFSKPTSYLSHMRKIHPSKHVCDICGDSFIGRHGLLMHRSKTHRGEKPEGSVEPESERFCAECNIQFQSRVAWQRHILSSAIHLLHNEKSLQCKICESDFQNKRALERHMKEHGRALNPHQPQARHTQPTVHCDQCGSGFINRSKLQAHVKRIHLGLKYNKNIVCEFCGKKCTSNASLLYHQRTHTGERPHPCPTCDKKFADKNQLRIHTRTHTGEKPYCCGSCGKRFSQKPALNRHYRVHTGAKPYPCTYCGKTFSQSNSLKLHVNTVHLKLPPNRRSKQDNVPVSDMAETTVHNL